MASPNGQQVQESYALRHPRGRSQKQERTERAAPTRHRRRACSTEASAGDCLIPPSTASKHSSFDHLSCRIFIGPPGSICGGTEQWSPEGPGCLSKEDEKNNSPICGKKNRMADCFVKGSAEIGIL